jgi:hypothetical protein
LVSQSRARCIRIAHGGSVGGRYYCRVDWRNMCCTRRSRSRKRSQILSLGVNAPSRENFTAPADYSKSAAEAWAVEPTAKLRQESNTECEDCDSRLQVRRRGDAIRPSAGLLTLAWFCCWATPTGSAQRSHSRLPLHRDLHAKTRGAFDKSIRLVDTLYSPARGRQLFAPSACSNPETLHMHVTDVPTYIETIRLTQAFHLRRQADL